VSVSSSAFSKRPPFLSVLSSMFWRWFRKTTVALLDEGWTGWQRCRRRDGRWWRCERLGGGW
jgi:hypothetical protein